MRRAVIFFCLLFFIPLLAHASVVNRSSTSAVTNGLLGYWTFDGRDIVNGVVRDLSGQANHGNPFNIASSTFYTRGKIGQGVRFDGINDRIEVPANASLNTKAPLTVSAWIKPVSYGGGNQGAIIAKTNGGSAGWWFVANGSSGHNTLAFTVGFNPAGMIVNGTDDVLVLNQWQHVVFTWDGTVNTSGVHIYKNGVETTYGTVSNGSGTINDDSAFNLTIGTLSGGTQMFDGTIDDVHLYNRVLSASEIRKLYSQGSNGKIGVSPLNPLDTGLLGYWTFDGKNTPGRALDLSGNDNSAYFYNIASSTFYTRGKMGQAVNYSGVTGTGSAFTRVNPGTTFTYSGWIYIPSGTININSNLMTNGNAIGLWITTDKINFDAGGAHLSNTAMTRNAWHHVAVVDNATAVTFYLDGVADGSTSIATDMFFNSMGCDDGTGAECFTGKQDDVRLYSRALSATEIRQLYSLGQGKQNVSVAQPVKTGLVGYWTFDGKDMPNGVARDVSGNGYNGNLLNVASSTFYAAGKIGQALKFDGVNDYVRTPVLTYVPTLATPHSVFGWVYPDASSANTFGVVSYGEFDDVNVTSGLGISGNKVAWLENGDLSSSAVISTTLTVPAQTWSFIGFVRTATNVTLYLNGSSETINNSDVDVIGTDPILIGATARNGSVTGYFPGRIDNTRIYTKALSTNEVSQLYNLGR
jgi:hypothetical protein